MLDYVREGWVPRSVRDKEHALTQGYAALEREHGRPATAEEVAAWLGLDLDTRTTGSPRSAGSPY